MILSNRAESAAPLTETQHVSRATGSIFTRKIWLPKRVYAVLPTFYAIAGLASLLATLYIGHWLWALPHYIFFSAACFHLGLLIYLRRRRTPKTEK